MSTHAVEDAPAPTPSTTTRARASSALFTVFTDVDSILPLYLCAGRPQDQVDAVSAL